nr:peptidylprolyl isomerase [Achromobacter sp. DMS1]
MRVPEGSSPDQVAMLRKKAEGLLARAKRGDDFASLAAASSDGPEALQGGMMGVRPAEGWRDLSSRRSRAWARARSARSSRAATVFTS